jgi:hypothetical protein
MMARPDDAAAGEEDDLADAEGYVADLREELRRALGPELPVLRVELAAGLIELHGRRAGAGSESARADLSEAIGQAELAISDPVAPAGAASQALLSAGMARYLRAVECDEPADLDVAARHLTAALDLSERADFSEQPAILGTARDDPAPDDPDLRLAALAALADVLAARARVAPRGSAAGQADLSAAIRVQEQLCGELDAAGAPEPAFIVNLGRLRYERYQLQSVAAGGAGPDGTADLDMAIACLRRIVGDPSADPAVSAEASLFLGQALARLAIPEAVRPGTARPGTGSTRAALPAELDEALAALAQARQALDGEPIDAALCDLYTGVILGIRYLAGGGPMEDRELGLAALRGALRDRELAAEPALADLARIWLGQLLVTPLPPGEAGPAPVVSRDWGEQMRAILATPAFQESAAEAVDVLSLVSAQALADPETASAVAGLIGAGLLARGPGALPAAELGQLISHFALAAAAAPSGAPGSAELTAMHGWLLAERAGRPGNEADIEPAVTVLSAARDRLPAADRMLRPIVLHQLGILLGRRGIRLSAGADLVAGITALTEALALLDADHPLRPETLGMLGAALVSAAQYDLPGARLDRTISVLEEARRVPHPDAAKQATFLCCYGQALHLRAIRDRDTPGFAAAAACLHDAEKILPAGHPHQAFLMVTLASMLADQFDYLGDLESLEAASFYLDRADAVLTAAGAPARDPEAMCLGLTRATRGHVRMQLAHRRQDRTLLAAAVADLDFVVAAMPRDHPMRPRLVSDLSAAQLALATMDEDRHGLTRSLDGLSAAGQEAQEGHVDQPALAGRAGMIQLLRAVADQDLGLLNEAIARLRRVAAQPGMLSGDRVRLSWAAAFGFSTRYDVARSRPDIEAAVVKLEEARHYLDAEPNNPVAAHVLADLAQAYRKRGDPARGDHRRAIRTGIAALREQARDVLLQTSPERAMTMTRAAAADAAEISAWCRADGAADQAIEALDLSRGLVLHAASSAAGLPDLLRAAGHAGLADEWEKARGAVPSPPWEGGLSGAEERQLERVSAMVTDLPSLEVPGDLRHRVLQALAGAGLDRALLSPPDAAEVTAVLRATGTSLAAYLVAAGEQGGGYAVIVRADGSVQDLPLPELDVSPGSALQECAAAEQNALGSGDGPAAALARERWARSLDRLADWAWATVVRKLLVPLLVDAAAGASGQPPRLLLIPFGLLGMVPWHAASYTDSSGRRQHACQHAVFSYAASARQFADAVGRPVLPRQAGHVLVADPSRTLPWAAWETGALQSAFYPDAALLGHRPPQATPARVLAALPGSAGQPGAALIHLSCHAQSGPSSVRSCLYLEPGAQEPGSGRLQADEILRQAVRRPAGAPGGLVVLAACATDLSPGDYDEALTLASAFMTAGAVTVVGTRWSVPDARTAIMMFMFHHFISAGRAPAAALSQAQAWMLNADREVPEEMPSILAEAIPDQDLADPISWAAFAHQGR